MRMFYFPQLFQVRFSSWVNFCSQSNDSMRSLLGLGRGCQMSTPAAALPCRGWDKGAHATASALPPAHLPGICSMWRAERDHLLHLPMSKRKIPVQVMVLWATSIFLFTAWLTHNSHPGTAAKVKYKHEHKTFYDQGNTKICNQWGTTVHGFDLVMNQAPAVSNKVKLHLPLSSQNHSLC